MLYLITYILHNDGWCHLPVWFNTCRLPLPLKNNKQTISSRNQNSQFPPASSPVCRVIMIPHYAAVVIVRWPKWLPEMHACDQSAVACWSSLFPDIVHSPQAPATDNGSLCQTERGRISSRMLGVLCWMAAMRWCSLGWKCRAQTKIWKGICYAECVM